MAGDEVSVVKVKEDSVDVAVREAINLIGGMKRVVKKGDRVFIKPNAVVPLPHDVGVVTNPAVVKSLISIVLEAGAGRVVVGDSPFFPYKARDVLGKVGIEEVARQTGVEVAYLDEEPYQEVNAPSAKIMTRIRLPKSFLRCNVFITVPKMKTHNQAVVSLSIKNQHGLLRPEDKKLMHRDDIHQKLVDITSLAKPNLAVVDGTIALEGQGPTYGSPVRMDLIIAGCNVVSVDAVASSIMGFDPSSIPTLRLAEMQNMGSFNLAEFALRGQT